MIKLLQQNISIGHINLVGKVFGKALFLVLTSILAKYLEFKIFSLYAIFWVTLRLFVFFSANNLYILFFNKVRNNLKNNKWSIVISSNIFYTTLFFGVLIIPSSLLIFKNITYTIILFFCVCFNIVIRNLCEFSKADDNIWLSVLVEDIYLNVVLFTITLTTLFLNPENIFIWLIVSILTSYTFILCVSIYLFKNKFKLKFTTFKLRLRFFSKGFFLQGLSLSFLRANETYVSFGARYMGKIYFGDLFVAYTHIMFQFYNLFILLTTSIVSGLQSKITLNDNSLNRDYFIKIINKLSKIILPLCVIGLVFMLIFSKTILELFFVKYVNYNDLLIKVVLIGLIFAFVQPGLYIFIYNGILVNRKLMLIIQYLFTLTILISPFFIKNINEQSWLLFLLSSSSIIQGFYLAFNYYKLK